MDGSHALTIRVPGDKSITQRALILGALAQGESRIGGMLRGADPVATGRALRSLGVEITNLAGPDDASVRIKGRGFRAWRQPDGQLDLRNTGTGARLLAGALAAQPLSAVLAGDASLSSRPMERIAAPLRRMGASVDYLGRQGVLPMRVTGGALSGVRHDGQVASAQVKSAILLAGVGAGVAVEVREPRQSRDHSERMLTAMGVEMEERAEGDAWSVSIPAPPPSLAPIDLEVPGDFSSAAFFLAWAALAGGRMPLTIRAVGLNATRTGFLRVLARMGVQVEVERRAAGGGEVAGDLHAASPPNPLRAVEVGDGEVPGMIDELPVLAILAARADGVTRITGAEELRVKESDRLAALAVNLRRIGVNVGELPDGLEIEGTSRPLSGLVECFRDHRIAMAFGVLGAAPGCDIRVDDPRVADVSFPGFWNLLARVGNRGGEGGPTGIARPVARSGTPHAQRGSSAGCTIVAIDGSAGSGKSTTAAAVAAQLGFRHLDSGALYRAVTLGLLDAGLVGVPPEEVTSSDLVDLAVDIRWRGAQMKVWSGGRAVPEAALREERVTSFVSRISALSAVRDHLLDLQRRAAEGPGLVAEGRDMGTVVFPEAAVKVYLDAEPRERARRRILQRGGRDPRAAEIEAEAGRLRMRDERDSSRAVAPLLRAEDAVRLDTTQLEPASQAAAIVRMVRDARLRRGPVRRDRG